MCFSADPQNSMLFENELAKSGHDQVVCQDHATALFYDDSLWKN